MKLSTPLAFAAFLFICVTVFESECCGGGSSSGGGGDSSSSSDSYKQTPRGKKISVGKVNVLIGKTGIRERDETGHRTGLGTIIRSAVKDPVGTYKGLKAFRDNNNDMKEKNIIGGNIPAHEKANKEASEVSSKKLAAGISAMREQYKNFRPSKTKSGVRVFGDTRTEKERKDTMDANRRGREQAGR